MCEIFPEVSTCCLCISLRIGMLFISVLAIMTGVTMLCIIEKVSDASYKRLKNVTEIRDTEQAMSQSALFVPSGITVIACVFMFTGIVLLFATLTDQEGWAQVFVWMTFAILIFGFILVLVTGVECVMMPKCILSGMDWLSGAATLVLAVVCMFVWLYFVIVANSYVINVYA